MNCAVLVTKFLNRLRIEHLWVLAVLVGVFAFVNTHPIRPNDFWFHLAAARETLQTGHIPQVDTFSFTSPGTPYLSNNTFWLMQVILYGIYTTSGAAWLILLTSLTITLAYGLLIKIGIQLTKGNWRAAAIGVLFAAVLGIDNWNVRPQIAAYLYAAICLFAVNALRSGCRRHWLMVYPIVMLFWVNSHGTFFIGLVLLAFWGLEVAIQVILQWKHLGRWDFKPLTAPVGLGIVSGLACLLNPQGIGIVRYLASMSTSPVIQDLILEWQPPQLSSAGGIIFFVLLAASGLLILLPRRRVDLFQVLCYVFFGILAMRYNRAIVWFGIIMAPAVAIGVSTWMDRVMHAPENRENPRGERRMNVLLALLLGGLAVFSLPWFKPWWPVQPEKKGLLAYDTPIQATQFLLERELPAPVFHDLAFGSYMDWAAVPAYHVFVDPRFELYPVEVWQDYLEISYASLDWEQRLEKYGIQTLMLHPNNQAALITAAENSKDWEWLYKDQAATIFVRR